jgi:hypothetical protein
MSELQREQKRIDREIVSIAEPVNIVILHRPRRPLLIESERSFSRAALQVNPANNELTASVRDLIEVAIVQPTPARRDARCAGALLGSWPRRVSEGPHVEGKMVAEE